MLMRNLFLKTLRDYRWSILGYGIGMTLYGLLVVSVYPYIEGVPGLGDLLESYPPALRNIFGFEDIHAFITLEGFLSVEMFSLAPLIIAIFTITAGGGLLAGEEEKGTLDLLLSNPLPRWRLVLEKYAALVVALLLICLLTAAGLFIGAVIIEETVAGKKLLSGALNLFPITLLFGTLTLFLTSLLRRRVAVGVGVALMIGTYLWNGLAPMVPELEASRQYTPFYLYHAQEVLAEGIRWGDWGILAGLSLALLLLSLPLFRRKDLAV